MSDLRFYPGPLITVHGDAMHMNGDVYRGPSCAASPRIAMAVNAAWRDAWLAEARRRVQAEQPVVSVGLGGADQPRHVPARRRGDKQTTLGDLLQRDEAEVQRTADHLGKLLKLPKLATLNDWKGADRSEWFPGTQAPWEPGVYQRHIIGGEHISSSYPEFAWYAHWDGEHWYQWDATPELALKWRDKDWSGIVQLDWTTSWRGISALQHNHWRALEKIADHFPWPPLPQSDASLSACPD